MKNYISKRFFQLAVISAFAVSAAGCDAFRNLRDSNSMTAQGRPYELVVVCGHDAWNGELGDSLRTVFTAPVPYLNQTEPLFDVLRITERGYTGTIAQHRNILKVVVDPTLQQAEAGVQYDLTAEPQIVVTLQGPTQQALTEYLSAHRTEMVHVFEQSERDRAIRFTEQYFAPEVSKAIEARFGVRMKVPRGYIVAASQPDFVWARYEYPQASQGFFVYSYPYEGPQSLSERPCSQPATSSQPAFRARRTVPT